MFHRRKQQQYPPSITGSYLDLASKPINPFVCTPGSFVSDLFFYDELSRIAGVEAGHNWFCTQMAARSKGTTLTPSTPCKSPYSSAPASPRSLAHSVDLDESSDYLQPQPLPFCEVPSNDGIPSHDFRGYASFSCKNSALGNTENTQPVRLASTGFIKRSDFRGKQSWRRWKSYDGARKAILEGGGHMALAEQEHEEAQSSSSSSSCADDGDKCPDSAKSGGSESTLCPEPISAAGSPSAERQAQPEPPPPAADH